MIDKPQIISPTNCIYISASYYTSCPTTGGGGACGTCNNNDLQCAWSNLFDFPPDNSIVATCGSTFCCGEFCAEYDIPAFSCGDEIYVTDLCTNNSSYITVADHGPYVCICDNNCGYDNLMRAMDLTEAAFLYLQGSLTIGHIPVTVCYG